MLTTPSALFSCAGYFLKRAKCATSDCCHLAIAAELGFGAFFFVEGASGTPGVAVSFCAISHVIDSSEFWPEPQIIKPSTGGAPTICGSKLLRHAEETASSLSPGMQL